MKKIIGIQCNTTGYGYYSYKENEIEIFKIGHHVLPNPDVNLEGFDEVWWHREFDPFLTIGYGVRRNITDGTGKIVGFYKYVDVHSFQIVCGKSVAEVAVSDAGWEILCENQMIARITRINSSERKVYEEDGFEKREIYEVDFFKEKEFLLKAMILSIPILGF